MMPWPSMFLLPLRRADARRKNRTSVKRATDCLRRTLLTVYSVINTVSDLVEAVEDENVAAVVVESLGVLEILFFGYSNAMKRVARKIRQQRRREGGGDAGAAASGGRDAGGAA
ncbi:hypothetical protein OPV22_033231 [Ensete ventricosum]|uniref:Uncharacterized protein n=1 Tax=Ensete ventricosum TaxID=4639 RepID=A0AAV8PZI9_ENSVE|nr:hypothetical protein OPV22_033231 [Ensete ventricosum]